MPGTIFGFEAVHALIARPRERGLQPLALGRVELEQRLEDEAAVPQLGMRHVVVERVDRRMREHEHVDVERARRVSRRVRVAAQLHLDALRRREQLVRRELGVDLDAGVQEVLLTDGAGLGLGLVDVRALDDADAVALQRGAAAAQIRKAVADVRPQPEPGLQSVRSFQTSTVTSSTGSGIGGSGLVARTVTASAP